MNLRTSLAVLSLSLVGVAYAADGPYDLVLRNARIVDGTGSPWYRADLAVRGDTIMRIAPSITEPARRVIDVGGNVVSPGFIDVHTHAGREIFQVPTADVTLWPVENGSCGGFVHAIGEEDVVRVTAHPATMIASDGGVVQFGVGAPHPRSYGTFARVLGVYVREKGVITLEDAVRKMTSYPASRLALQDRGVLKVGMKADIAVFDPARVKDMATFEKPHQYAAGFEYVVVNGQVVYEGGRMTEAAVQLLFCKLVEGSFIELRSWGGSA